MHIITNSLKAYVESLSHISLKSKSTYYILRLQLLILSYNLMFHQT